MGQHEVLFSVTKSFCSRYQRPSLACSSESRAGSQSSPAEMIETSTSALCAAKYNQRPYFCASWIPIVTNQLLFGIRCLFDQLADGPEVQR
jgi:hypothetical protein